MGAAISYDTKKLKAVAAKLGVSEADALQRAIATGLEQLAFNKRSSPGTRKTAADTGNIPNRQTARILRTEDKGRTFKTSRAAIQHLKKIYAGA